MPILKNLKDLEKTDLPAEGYMYHDKTVLTPAQRDCTTRLGKTIQFEQEAYLMKHPEVIAMQKLFVAKLVRGMKRRDVLQQAVIFFTRPAEELDRDIRQFLNLPATGPYTTEDSAMFDYKDNQLEQDLQKVIAEHYPSKFWEIPATPESTINTISSSFISFLTSDSTLPTPEQAPIPEPTISEAFFTLISNTVDKAVFAHVDEAMIVYDTAYVELQKIVEEAMEIPVIKIREDIAEIFNNAYMAFEFIIMEKEKVAAAIAWEKRMRKKLKRTLRRQKNYKGYETPPSPKSTISSRPSYKEPPPRPCICHPQMNYNRYEKDRFGIYLPREETFETANITVTPAISLEAIDNDETAETKSVISKKSMVSGKSVKIVTLTKKSKN